MTNIADEETEGEIAYHKKGINQAKERIKEDTIPDDRYPIVYYSMGMDAKKIGIWCLVRTDTADAHQWFSRAATYYLKRVQKGQDLRNELEKSYWENEPLTFRNALYCAILSDDPDLRAEVATEALAMDDAYLTEFPTTVHDYYFVQALAAILLDRDDARQRVADAKASLDHLRPELHTYFEAMALIVEGIANPDAQTTIDGMKQLLADHDGDIQGTPKRADKIVCLPATAFLVLAREHGLDVKIENEYIPDSLLA